MDIKNVFRMPTPVKITRRSSSITNSFVNGVIPCIVPTEEEVQEVLLILGMDNGIRCAYCGGQYTEWDHFRPLEKNKRPTGYISEINNLVPSCGKCNQSKGNSYWREWILSDAALSPKNRNVDNLAFIIRRLDEYERWSNPIKIDFEEMVDRNIWERHWDNYQKLHDMMQESQKLSDHIKWAVENNLKNSNELTSSEPFQKDKQPKSIMNNKISEERKVAVIVKSELLPILESNEIPHDVIEMFQTLKYSKMVFKLNFPLLIEIRNFALIDELKKDKKGRARYYKNPILIHNKYYLLCSQWYDYNRSPLLKWIHSWNIRKGEY